MDRRASGLLALSIAAGIAAWLMADSNLDSWSKAHAVWPLAALCVVAGGAAVYLVIGDRKRPR